jgi:FlgD Ig-like domain
MALEAYFHLERTMKRMQSIYRNIGAVLFVLALANPASAYVVGDWTVVQITDNDTNDSYPRVSGNTVVWSGMGTTSSWQIFMWRDGIITQVTNDGLTNVQPRIGGGLVVWTATASQVFAYDLTVQALTPSYETHQMPEASVGSAAWLGRPSGNAFDIYYYDGTDVTRLTNTSNQKYDVRISGTSVVWWGLGANGTGEAYYHDGTTLTQLTTNTYNDKNTRVSDGGPGNLHVTYESLINGYWDIMHYDGTTTTNLTDTPTIHEYGHQVCGNRTVWLAPNSGQNGIWLHDGTSASPISPVGIFATDPQVSESLVTWWGTPWGEIYVYDGTTVTQLTDNGVLSDLHPMVDGGTVVWFGNDGNDDEIFMAYKTPTVVAATPNAQAPTLFDAMPNPFNPSTTIAFEIPSQTEVSLRVYDLSGRLVSELANHEAFAQGHHEVQWNGIDDSGRRVASGTYFYRLESAEFTETKSMTLVK